MRLDPTDLRLFGEVAECGSLTRAARRSHLSPAAASARIKSLEQALGTVLFYRDSRGMEPTPAGTRLLGHARRVLRQLDALQAEFAEFGAVGSGHVRIFANTTAVTEFLPEILATFLVDKPALTIDLRERPTRAIVRGVLDGSADLGVVAGPVPRNGLETIHFSTDRLMLAVPRGHPLQAQPRVSLRQALDYQHISLSEGTTLHSFLSEQVQRLGEHFPLRIQVTSFEAVCRLVEAGVGIGVIPESAARRHSRTMDIHTIDLDEAWARRERCMIVRELDALPASARALIEAIKAHPWPQPAP